MQFYSILPYLNRVPTDLESQDKPGKKSGQLKSGNFFYFSKKSGKVRFKKKNADCHENTMIFIWKLSRLSFHAPSKTSFKMSKIVREICVQVMEVFFRFLVGTLLKVVRNFHRLVLITFLGKKLHSFPHLQNWGIRLGKWLGVNFITTHIRRLTFTIPLLYTQFLSPPSHHVHLQHCDTHVSLKYQFTS